MLSKSGVCYELENSPYTSNINGYELKFSTMRAKNKFDSEYSAFLEKLINRYERIAAINMLDLGGLSELAAIKLYKDIESRGFCIMLPSGIYARKPDSFYTVIDVRYEDYLL